jgi:hypothetical protein
MKNDETSNACGRYRGDRRAYRLLVEKSRMMRLAVRVAGTGETEGPIDCWWRKRPTW